MEGFQEKVQEWVSLDNQIKKLNDKTRELRDKRNQNEEIILQYVETENLSNATVKISDGKLRFTSSRQIQPLTFKHVEDCLIKCIQNPEQVEKIMAYIKETRDIKYIPDIKRTYHN
jgi:hypothetical protein